ncbi:hypothetical protein PAPYR_666 [Paratrimastix pyriformis]|uniref:Uncharacterized protein n=1 Tax=Paratrimastix pyriformis TaxID=342808 RepID=A0ABQ8UW52_9EUKA|nr:hypothetical protein PAPYR_666 [Paratrimastix pyriformis]
MSTLFFFLSSVARFFPVATRELANHLVVLKSGGLSPAYFAEQCHALLPPKLANTLSEFAMTSPNYPLPVEWGRLVNEHAQFMNDRLAVVQQYIRVSHCVDAPTQSFFEALSRLTTFLTLRANHLFLSSPAPPPTSPIVIPYPQHATSTLFLAPTKRLEIPHRSPSTSPPRPLEAAVPLAYFDLLPDELIRLIFYQAPHTDPLIPQTDENPPTSGPLTPVSSPSPRLLPPPFAPSARTPPIRPANVFGMPNASLRLTPRQQQHQQQPSRPSHRHRRCCEAVFPESRGYYHPSDQHLISLFLALLRVSRRLARIARSSWPRLGFSGHPEGVNRLDALIRPQLGLETLALSRIGLPECVFPSLLAVAPADGVPPTNSPISTAVAPAQTVSSSSADHVAAPPPSAAVLPGVVPGISLVHLYLNDAEIHTPLHIVSPTLRTLALREVVVGGCLLVCCPILEHLAITGGFVRPGSLQRCLDLLPRVSPRLQTLEVPRMPFHFSHPGLVSLRTTLGVLLPSPGPTSQCSCHPGAAIVGGSPEPEPDPWLGFGPEAIPGLPDFVPAPLLPPPPPLPPSLPPRHQTHSRRRRRPPAPAPPGQAAWSMELNFPSLRYADLKFDAPPGSHLRFYAPGLVTLVLQCFVNDLTFETLGLQTGDSLEELEVVSDAPTRFIAAGLEAHLHLPSLGSFKRLRVLRLCDCRELRGFRWPHGGLSTLQEIRLRQCPALGDASIQAIGANAPALRTLVLRECGTCFDAAERAGEPIELPEEDDDQSESDPEEAKMRREPCGFWAPTFVAPTLRVLSILHREATSFAPPFHQWLEPSPAQHLNLRTLALTELNLIGLVHLELGSMPLDSLSSLRILRLNGVTLTGPSLARILGLGALEVCDLSNCTGLVALRCRHPSLRQLQLSVTDPSLSAITKYVWLDCPRLQTLDITGHTDLAGISLRCPALGSLNMERTIIRASPISREELLLAGPADDTQPDPTLAGSACCSPSATSPAIGMLSPGADEVPAAPSPDRGLVLGSPAAVAPSPPPAASPTPLVMADEAPFANTVEMYCPALRVIVGCAPQLLPALPFHPFLRATATLHTLAFTQGCPLDDPTLAAWLEVCMRLHKLSVAECARIVSPCLHSPTVREVAVVGCSNMTSILLTTPALHKLDLSQSTHLDFSSALTRWEAPLLRELRLCECPTLTDVHLVRITLDHLALIQLEVGGCSTVCADVRGNATREGGDASAEDDDAF